MRTLFIHQKMLEERSMTLCNNLQICIDKRNHSLKKKHIQIILFGLFLVLNYQSEMNK
jgi:hypothetical protein